MLIGATLFGLASLLAAFATSTEMLIAARAVLGIAGATIAPSTLSLLRNMFHDPAQFSAAVGVWVSGFSAGSAIGPLLGGVLLERFWWGSVFLISVPVMVVLLITAPLLLPEYRDLNAGRLDLVSAALSLISVLAVIYGLKQIAVEGLGWPSALTIVAGLAVCTFFVRRQRTLADPLIDLKLFASRAFSGSLAMYMLSVLFVFGIFYFTGQYLQLVAGMSPLQAGLWSLPSAAAFIIGSNLASRIVRRFRPGRVVAVGLLVGAIGLAMLSQVGVDSLPLLLLGSFIMSVGVSPVITLATDIIVGAAPPEQAGAASGISETSAEFGGALGIAFLGSIGTAVYRNQVATRLPADVPPAAATAAHETLGGAVAAAAQLPEPLAGSLLDAAREAFVQGLQLSALIGAVGLIGTAVLVAFLLRSLPATAEGGEQAEPTASERSLDAAQAAC